MFKSINLNQNETSIGMRSLEPTPGSSKMMDRLKKVISNRLTSPAGRCVSPNVEISDLMLIRVNNNLNILKNQLINRINKMYYFCNLKKKQKVKLNILKIIDRLEQ